MDLFRHLRIHTQKRKDNAKKNKGVIKGVDRKKKKKS